MFKIGEFSKLTQVSIRMLRYYDEMGLLKPSQIDPWTGYRMYSVEQIPVLNKIVYLRDSGFNVAEIAVALTNEEEQQLIEQLNAKYTQIENTILEEKEKLKKIELAKKELVHKKSEMHYNISLKSIPAYQVLSLRRVVPTYYHESELWKELSSFATQNHIPVSNIARAYLAFSDWLQKNSEYKMSGPNRQLVHRGPWNEPNPDKYLTEIQIPLENRTFFLDSHMM